MVERGRRGGAWLGIRVNRWGGTNGCTLKLGALCGRVGVRRAKEAKLTYPVLRSLWCARILDPQDLSQKLYVKVQDGRRLEFLT